jgi:hypothetical protein
VDDEDAIAYDPLRMRDGVIGLDEGHLQSQYLETL